MISFPNIDALVLNDSSMLEVYADFDGNRTLAKTPFKNHITSFAICCFWHILELNFSHFIDIEQRFSQLSVGSTTEKKIVWKCYSKVVLNLLWNPNTTHKTQRLAL